MVRLQAKTVEEAIATLQKFQAWQPFKYSGINYVRQIDDETFGFYIRQPKTNNFQLYKIKK